MLYIINAILDTSSNSNFKTNIWKNENNFIHFNSIKDRAWIARQKNLLTSKLHMPLCLKIKPEPFRPPTPPLFENNMHKKYKWPRTCITCMCCNSGGVGHLIRCFSSHKKSVPVAGNLRMILLQPCEPSGNYCCDTLKTIPC